MIPITSMLPAAARKKRPRFRSAGIRCGPMGMTTSMTKTPASVMTGPRMNRGLSAPAGMMSSLPRSLIPSASVWSQPCQPTSMGPRRLCMCAETLRSSQIANSGKRVATIGATTATMIPRLPASVRSVPQRSKVSGPRSFWSSQRTPVGPEGFGSVWARSGITGPPLRGRCRSSL